MNVVIIGQGGHSKVIKEMINAFPNYEIFGYLDDKFQEDVFESGAFFGPVESAFKLADYFTDIKFFIAIGDNRIRKSISQRLDFSSDQFISVIHRTAVISPNAKIGLGTVIMPFAVVNADTLIGDHSIINTHTVIEHDCHIGDFVHISPNATLTGSILVGEGVHIGAGANIIPNTKINEWSVIGAGATVINDIPKNCVAVGVPAKVKKERVSGGALNW